MNYEFKTKLWEYTGKGSWHFVTLPVDQALEIREITSGNTNGFGSVRVNVEVGSSTWKTSIFPDTKNDSYVLPIKKTVRTAENISDGSTLTVSISLIDQV
ncbi:MAG: hypothetical protein ACI9T8_000239 [Candidatus Saccharimonadales bacterium]|jgi:hypothetical protein